MTWPARPTSPTRAQPPISTSSAADLSSDRDLSAGDLASNPTLDLAGADLTSAVVGVSCGGMTCPGGCCVRQNAAPYCISGGTACSGVALLCDGPEDCPSLQLCCANQQGSSCSVAVCGINTARLCHVKADCPLLSNCCPYMNTGYNYCSNQPC